MGSSKMANVALENKETLQRIVKRKAVKSVILVNAEGTPVKVVPDASTDPDNAIDAETALKYAQKSRELAMLSENCVRVLDPDNQLVFVRIRSKHEEIMIAPDADSLVIATQDMRKLEKDSA